MKSLAPLPRTDSRPVEAEAAWSEAGGLGARQAAVESMWWRGRGGATTAVKRDHQRRQERAADVVSGVWMRVAAWAVSARPEVGGGDYGDVARCVGCGGGRGEWALCHLRAGPILDQKWVASGRARPSFVSVLI